MGMDTMQILLQRIREKSIERWLMFQEAVVQAAWNCGIQRGVGRLVWWLSMGLSAI